MGDISVSRNSPLVPQGFPQKEKLDFDSTTPEIIKKQLLFQQQQIAQRLGTKSFGKDNLCQSLMRRIEHLASTLIEAKEVSAKDLSELNDCERQLNELKSSLPEATNESYNSNIVEAGNVLTHLRDLVSSVQVYHNRGQLFLEKDAAFDAAQSKDPLLGLPALKDLLKNLSIWDKELNDFAKNQTEVVRLKLYELHYVKMEDLEIELGVWIKVVQRSFDQHLKRLETRVQSKDTVKPQQTSRLLAVLKDHLTEMQKESKELASLPYLPLRLQKRLKTLEGVFKDTQNRIDKQKPSKAAGMKYGSDSWFASMEGIPKRPPGMMSRLFSYFKPLDYIPEKWRPSLKKVGAAFAVGLLAGAGITTLVKNHSVSVAVEPSPAIGTIPDVAIPIIQSIGQGHAVIAKQPTPFQLMRTMWDIQNDGHEALETLKQLKILDDPKILSEIKELRQKIHEVQRGASDNEAPSEVVSMWQRDMAQLVRQVSRLRAKVAVVTKEAEIRLLEKENVALIHETISAPAVVPSYEMYQNLVQLYEPNIWVNLPALKVDTASCARMIMDTQRVYLKALANHPDISTACRAEACSAVFGDFPELSNDKRALQNVIEKMDFALSLENITDPNQQSKQIKDKFHALKKGDSFILPLKWTKGQIVEIERGHTDKIVMRLWDANTYEKKNGQITYSYYASDTYERQFHFKEVVNIEPARVFNGPFFAFFSRAEPRDMDEVSLQSLGGQISGRKDSAELLRYPYPHVEMPSLMALLDKAYVSTSLSARMRTFTLFRATKAFKDTINWQQINWDYSKRDRTILEMGCRATLEAITGAIEVGGLIGQEPLEMIEEIKEIQTKIKEAEEIDFGDLPYYDLTLSDYKEGRYRGPDLGKIQRIPNIVLPKGPVSVKKDSTLNSAEPPLESMEPAGFAPLPFENKALEKLTLLKDKLTLRETEVLTALKIDEVFQVGLEQTRSIAAANTSPFFKITEHLALFKGWGDFFDKDLLSLLQTQLLDHEALTQNIKHDPGLVQALGDFCNKGLLLGRLRDASFEAYFAYIARFIQQNLKKVEGPDVPIDWGRIPSSDNIFSDLIQSGEGVEQLQKIHYYRIKSFETTREVTIDEAAELLSSMYYLNANGLPQNLSVSLRNQYSRIMPLAAKAKAYLDQPENANKILNRIAKDIDRQHEDEDWSWQPHNNSFVNSGETISYDRQTGIATRITLGKRPIPEFLAKDPLVKSILAEGTKFLDCIGNIMNGDAYSYQRDGVLYRFIINYEMVQEHKSQNNIHWYFEPSSVSVLRQFPVREADPQYPNGVKQWFLASSEETTPNFADNLMIHFSSVNGREDWFKNGIRWTPLFSYLPVVEEKDGIPFEKDKIHTQGEGGDIDFYTGPSGQPILKFSTAPGESLKRAELMSPDMHSTGLFSLSFGDTTLNNHLIKRIEHPEFSFTFLKNTKLAKIIFPRMGLEFTASQKGILESPQLDGFGLFEGPSYLPIFGRFESYLPLKKVVNGKEEMGVIIPFGKVGHKERAKIPLQTTTEIQSVKRAWMEKAPYFFYRLRGDVLEPVVSDNFQAIQANLHLVSIFLHERRFEEANKYLNIVDTLLNSSREPLNESLLDQLSDIINYSIAPKQESNTLWHADDQSPNAEVLRLRALAKFHRLASLGLVESSKPAELNEKIRLDYRSFDHYRQHINRVSINLRLTEEENAHLSAFFSTSRSPMTSKYAYPAAPTKKVHAHRSLSVWDFNRQIPEVNREYFSGGFNKHSSIVTTPAPVFLRRFPDGIWPLLDLLQNPNNLGEGEIKRVADEFGLERSIDSHSLRAQCLTILHLRYNYWVGRSSDYEKRALILEERGQRATLKEWQLEMNLLQALIRVGKGEARVNTFGDLQKYWGLNRLLHTVENIDSLSEGLDNANLAANAPKQEASKKEPIPEASDSVSEIPKQPLVDDKSRRNFRLKRAKRDPIRRPEKEESLISYFKERGQSFLKNTKNTVTSLPGLLYEGLASKVPTLESASENTFSALTKGASYVTDAASSLKKTVHNELYRKGFKYAPPPLLKELHNQAIVDLWKKWVVPLSGPFFNLELETAHEANPTLMGPIFTRDLLPLTPENQNPHLFAISHAIDKQMTRAPWMLQDAPLISLVEFSRCFTETPLNKNTNTTLPFAVASKDDRLAGVFNNYNHKYQEFLSTNKEHAHTYAWKEKKLLKQHQQALQDRKELLSSGMDWQEKGIVEKLNSESKNLSVRLHSEVRLLRGSARHLTFEDAKAALGRGWDVKYLHDLNPNLSVGDIRDILEKTANLLLEKREIQRHQRLLAAIDKVMKADENSPQWQFEVEKLLTTITEQLHYNPYDYPALLLAETEFDIALWQEQVPAIKALAPRKQISALVELAMGMGKTDAITPTVLYMLADGETLPIYVTLEPLLPSTTSRLQQRLKMGYGSSIQTIPIGHENWTAEKILSLTRQLKEMMVNRIPITWSSMDIQTLINSFYKDIETSEKTLDLEYKMRPWQGLFQFLKSRAVILGDEIHAILDILTTYNLSFGEAKSLDQDEMEAVADFIGVFIKHPDVIKNMTLPFAETRGTIPLTEDYFKQTLAPKLAQTLMQRGLTGDPLCIELFESMDQARRDRIYDFLLSKPVGLKKEEGIFFPKIDVTKLDIPEERDKALALLLPSDREWIKGRIDFEDSIKELARDYEILNARLFNFLSVQKESLRIVFPLTATAQIGKHYVMNRAENGAVPADNGTPLWDSHFASSIERLYYAAFLYTQHDINRDIIEQDLENFVERFRTLIAEKKQLSTLDIDELLLDNPVVNEFHAHFGKTFRLRETGFTPMQIDQLTKWVNAKFERKIPFILKYIFPEQKVFPKEIETSTHFFPLIAKPKVGVSGESGTLFNIWTYPDVFQSVKDSQTLSLVTSRIKNVCPPDVIEVSFSNDPETVINEIYSKSKLGPGGIIDTTGLINQDAIEGYARAIHQKTGLNTVFYKKDIPMVMHKDKKQLTFYDPSMPQEELTCLWDVAHTTGSNILVKPNSHAFLIVGQHLRLFEFVQAAMRLRRLGSGQKLEIVVNGNDRSIMSTKLQKFLDITLDDHAPLTVDHIFQYALLNEFLGETENNWRAIDMRMRVVVLEPIMDLIWNENTPPEQALKAFNLVKEIFLRERKLEPWEKYGAEITKENTQESLDKLLKQWKTHPVLSKIKENPEIFPNINIDAILQKLDAIAKAEHGPLPLEVDSENYLGLKSREKVQVKNQVRVHVKPEKIAEAEIPRIKIKLDPPPRKPFVERPPVYPLIRDPYPLRPEIPLSDNLFADYKPLSLEEASALTFDQLLPGPLAQRNVEAAISAREWLKLDPSLADAFRLEDDAITISLNAAPVWIPGGVTPLHAPYNIFQKYPTHAVIIHNPNPNAVHPIQLKLVDASEAEAIAIKLKEDNDNPKAGVKREVLLSLYHLGLNRVVASGQTPANPEKRRDINQKIVELISKAKFLSGFIDYTKEEANVLENWMLQRKPLELLDKFLFEISRHREHVLQQFLPNSPLARIFEACGIEPSEMKKTLEDPVFDHAKKAQALLFDRAAQPGTSEWWDLALENAISSKNAAHDSNALVPLIPIRFERHPFYNERLHPKSEIDELTLRVQRRYMMNLFFPTVADEYGAWRTAVPQMVGPQIPPGIGENLLGWIRGNYGNDNDKAFLDASFKKNAITVSPTVAPVEQLETVSALTDPTLGLPLLSSQIKDLNTEYAQNLNDNDLLREKLAPLYDQVTSITKAYSSLAHRIAINAIGHLDLVASLKEIVKKDPNYAFERLYGLFAFLSNHDLDRKARREYALHVIPMFYGDLFPTQKVDVLYEEFIPSQLTVDPQHYTTQEVHNLLTKCYMGMPSDPPQGSRDPLGIQVLSAFTDKDHETAKKTAEWLNQLLPAKTNSPYMLKPPHTWWIDGLLIQLIKRQEPILDHSKLAAYFDLPEVKAFGPEKRGFVVDSDKVWKVTDFDLFAELKGIKTAKPPIFSVYEKANKWTEALKTMPGDTYLLAESKVIWKKILGPIAEAVTVNPPTDENDKIALQRLLAVVDDFSNKLNQVDFEFLQDELGPIRLAAEFSFDMSERHEFAIKQIRWMFSTEFSNSADSVWQTRLYEYFIPKFLLKDDEVITISSERLKTILDSFLDKTSFFWWYASSTFLNQKIARITSKGTLEQRAAFGEWINMKLLEPNLRNDLNLRFFVKHALEYSPEVIEHSKLVNSQAISPESLCLNDYIKKLATEANVVLPMSDLELFAEIVQLPTANRIPLSYDVYAEKLAKYIEEKTYKYEGGKHVESVEEDREKSGEKRKLISITVAKIIESASKVPEKERNQKSLINLLKAIEQFEEKYSNAWKYFGYNLNSAIERLKTLITPS